MKISILCVTSLLVAQSIKIDGAKSGHNPRKQMYQWRILPPQVDWSEVERVEKEVTSDDRRFSAIKDIPLHVETNREPSKRNIRDVSDQSASDTKTNNGNQAKKEWNETCTADDQCKSPFTCLSSGYCRCPPRKLFSVSRKNCYPVKVWKPKTIALYAISPVMILVSWTMRNKPQGHDIESFLLKYWKTGSVAETKTIPHKYSTMTFSTEITDLESNTEYNVQLVMQLKNGLKVESQIKTMSTSAVFTVQHVRLGNLIQNRRQFNLAFSRGCSQGVTMEIEGTNHYSKRNITFQEQYQPFVCFFYDTEKTITTEENEIPKGDVVTATFSSYFGPEGVSDLKTIKFKSCPNDVKEFKALSSNATSIVVEWEKPTGLLDNFTIAANGNQAPLAATVDGDETKYVIGQLRPDTSYTIQIFSNHGSCTSSSSPMSVRTYMDVLTNFDVTSPESGNVQLTGDFKHYRKYRQIVYCQGEVVYDKTESYYRYNTRIHKLPGGCCTVNVAGVNNAGVGLPVLQTVTVKTKAPGPPQNVHVTLSDDAKTATVIWSSPAQWSAQSRNHYNKVTYNATDVTAYNIDLFKEANGRPDRLVSSNIVRCSGTKCRHACEESDKQDDLQTFSFGETDFNASFALSSFTKYRVYVRAKSTSEMWGPSVKREFETPSMFAPGSPVTDVNIMNSTATTVTLTWKRPDKPNGHIQAYRVNWTHSVMPCDHLLNDSVEVENTTIVNSRFDITSYNVSDLKTFTTYSLTVTANNEIGESSFWSDPVNVTTKQILPLSVRNVEVSPSPTSCLIQWEAPCPVQSEIEGYTIKLSGIPIDIHTSNTSYNMTDLQPQTTYYMTIFARGPQENGREHIMKFSTPQSDTEVVPKWARELLQKVDILIQEVQDNHKDIKSELESYRTQLSKHYQPTKKTITEPEFVAVDFKEFFRDNRSTETGSPDNASNE